MPREIKVTNDHAFPENRWGHVERVIFIEDHSGGKWEIRPSEHGGLTIWCDGSEGVSAAISIHPHVANCIRLEAVVAKS